MLAPQPCTTLKDCKSVIAASYGTSSVTKFYQYIQRNFQYYLNKETIHVDHCIESQSNEKMLILVVQDLNDDMWFSITPGGYGCFVSVTEPILNKGRVVKCENHDIEIILAVYGKQECTREVVKILEDQMDGEELTVQAINELFGDSMYGIRKTLTVMYRIKLDDGKMSEPFIGFAMEGEFLKLNISQDKKHPSIAYQNPDILSLSPIIRKFRHEETNRKTNYSTRKEGINILYGVYGLADVTETVKEYLNKERNYLSVKATNDVFGDTWYGIQKYLVIYYTIDYEPDIYVAVQVEWETLTISQHKTNHILTAPLNESNTNIETNRDRIRIYGAMVGFSNRTKVMRSLFENNDGANRKLNFLENSKCLVMLYSIGDSSFKIFILQNGESRKLFDPGYSFFKSYINYNWESCIRISRKPTNVDEMFLNFEKNELIIREHDGKIKIQNWKNGEVLLKSRSDSMSSEYLVRTILLTSQRKVDDNFKLNGLFLLVRYESSHFEIPLVTVDASYMVRNSIPQLIRNNMVTNIDETLADKPGIKYSTQMFYLSDINICFK